MVHIQVGTNLYGRVLNVPGVLYVATVFRHVAFIPLAPLTSWIVIEEPGLRKYFRQHTRWQGYQVPIPVWRSVLAAWGRAGLVLFAGWQLLVEGYHALTSEPVARPWVAGALVAILAASVAGRLGRARFEQLDPLLRMADVPESLALRVEQAFGRRFQERWPGRDVRSPLATAEAGERWAPEDEPNPDPAEESVVEGEVALTFAQRNAPRIFAAVAIPFGLLLALWERSSARGVGHYSPEYLALGFGLMIGSVPALVLGIGRDRDLKVPWKLAVLSLFAIAGLAAGWSAPGWFF
jgi:hypothetical protein